MKFLKSFLGMLLLCALSGCAGNGREETQPTAYRVVSQVHITHQNGAQIAEYRYAAPENMQQLLNYLRWVDPYGAPAEDPLTQPGEEFFITLHYSDGTEKYYHQRCDRYLRAGEGSWKKIAPERGRELKVILESLGKEENALDPGADLPQPLLRPKLRWTKKEAVLLS